MEQNIVYFRIVGDFETEEILALIELEPTQRHDIGDMRGDKTAHTFSSITIGEKRFAQGEIINVEDSIEMLLGKEETLKAMRLNYSINFFLEVVLYVYESFPCINFGKNTIAFCAEVDATIDIDGYSY